MTPEDQKQKRIEYIQEIIFKYTTTEPILTPEEVIFSLLFHCPQDEDINKILKKVKKEWKSKW